MHVAAFHLGLLLNDRNILQIIRETLEDGKTNFGVSHLTTTEHDGDLHLATIFEEAHNMLLLGGVVANIDFGTELHFLDFDAALILAGLLGFDGLLVFELAIIHNAADRRLGIGGDFHLIKDGGISDALSFGLHIDAHLLSIIANQAAFACRDLLINPRFLSCY